MSSPFADYPKPTCSRCNTNVCNECDEMVLKYNELVKKYNKLISKNRELKKELNNTTNNNPYKLQV
jgi:hypothetical protein